MKTSFHLAATLALSVCALTITATTARPLNDTGETRCSNGTAYVECSAVKDTHPGQDARYGRDVAAGTSALPAKIGFGVGGFDFTKVNASGTPVAASATFGNGGTQYLCIRDNVTGLLWYGNAGGGAWRDSNPLTNGGFVGAPIVPNTETVAAEVNGLAGCGRTNWRLPTVRELWSILRVPSGMPVCYGLLPDAAFLWSGNVYWTSQTKVADPNYAHVVGIQDPNQYCMTGAILKFNGSDTRGIVLVSG